MEPREGLEVRVDEMVNVPHIEWIWKTNIQQSGNDTYKSIRNVSVKIQQLGELTRQVLFPKWRIFTVLLASGMRHLEQSTRLSPVVTHFFRAIGCERAPLGEASLSNLLG